MTPDEQFSAVGRMKKKIENNFLEFGQLLSEIKHSKVFKFKGYKTFKEFVEIEYNMASAFASKLISTYEIFIKDLDIDETSAKEIGFDRLNMIRPMLKDSSYEETAEWLKRAGDLSAAELREEVKDARDKKKDMSKTMKEVLTDQYLERMVTFFNCSTKELNFKLALYFQDSDLESIRKTVLERQRKFEEETETE
ncbi:MAG: hypothetical protein CSB55_06160 [Candidatus Cloacimonadota bacterium]|nr:MAG: hypothetical protein CSB55_06160 [Candidatus Cloacimonadota bacterium]